MTDELKMGEYILGVNSNGKSFRLGCYGGKLKSNFCGDYVEYYRVVWGEAKYTFKAEHVVKVSESKGKILERLLPLLGTEDESPLYYAELSDSKLNTLLKNAGKKPKAKAKAKTKPEVKVKAEA